MAAGGPVPGIILRAARFHEFAGQVISWTREGLRARVPDLHVQPIAARAVARVLVEVTEGAPVGRASDLAGPEAALVALARRLLERRGEAVTVHADRESASSIPPGAFLPGDGTRLEGPTFEEWLESEDAAASSL